MRRRLTIPPLERYVFAVIVAGASCVVLTLVFNQSSLHELLAPEVALFPVCALAGELVPLKVVTRGVEGEVTTSSTFAVAFLLTAGLEPAVIAYMGISLLADTLRRKSP